MCLSSDFFQEFWFTFDFLQFEHDMPVVVVCLYHAWCSLSFPGAVCILLTLRSLLRQLIHSQTGPFLFPGHQLDVDDPHVLSPSSEICVGLNIKIQT